jgi:hypothetical protein
MSQTNQIVSLMTVVHESSIVFSLFQYLSSHKICVCFCLVQYVNSGGDLLCVHKTPAYMSKLFHAPTSLFEVSPVVDACELYTVHCLCVL